MSKFEKLWLESINEIKIKNGHDSNKLRFYKLLNGSFKQDPYIYLVKNCNQRCHISRLRISAHILAIEKSRYSAEYIPPEQRTCKYCSLECQESEVHFLTQCPSFQFKRQCYLGKLSSLGVDISSYNYLSKAVVMLCPKNARETKLTNKYIDIMFNIRKQVDEGATIESIRMFNFSQTSDQYSDLNESLNNSLDSNNNLSDLDGDD